MFMVPIISFIIFYSVDNYIDDGSLHTDKTINLNVLGGRLYNPKFEEKK